MRALILALLLAMPAAAQELTTQVFGAWVLRCAGERCEVAASVSARPGGATVATLAFGTVRTVLTAPLGVALAPGLVVEAGDVTRRSAFTRCIVGGCLIDLQSGVPEVATLVAALEAGQPLTLALTGPDGEEARYRVPADGFRAAWAAR